MSRASNDALPAFVGIGALKAGTTYLDSLLRGHPDLSLPRHLKESEFFSRHHARGLEWYAGLFAPADGRLRGDISPQYVSSPGCPDRVHAANPEARVVVNLRDPVRRVVSQYQHWVQETGYRGDVEAFLAEHPNAVDRSRYADDLAPWLDRFGRDRVHVVVFEDLVAEPVATVRDVLGFLGAATTWTPDLDGRVTNTSFTPRFPLAYSAAKRLSTALRDGGQGRLVAAVKRSPLVGALKAGGSAPAPVPDGVRERLTDALRPDVAWVGELLGRDMSAVWSTPT